MTPDQIATVESAIAAMAAASSEYRDAAKLPPDSPDVAGWVDWLDRSRAQLEIILASPVSLPEQDAALLDAIEAQSEASRRYRISAGLPGASTDVPDWVAALDASQVALTEMVEAMRREILAVAEDDARRETEAIEGFGQATQRNPADET